MGTNILLYNFSAVLVIECFLSLYTSRGSIVSILLARAAIRYFWVLNSSGASSPTDSEFISKFMKGLGVQKKKYKPVKKAYPISYTELEQLFLGFVRMDISLINILTSKDLALVALLDLMKFNAYL